MSKEKLVFQVCDTEEEARRVAPETKKNLRLYVIEDPKAGKTFVLAPNQGEAVLAYTSQRLGIRVGKNTVEKVKKVRARKPKAADILNEYAASDVPEVKNLVEKLRGIITARKAVTTAPAPDAPPAPGEGDAPPAPPPAG